MEDTTLYQALYRVWRPKTFSDMVGQEAIVRTLRNQVNTGRIDYSRAKLVAYNHGNYYALGQALGFFGYSVAAPDVLKRRMKELK